MELETINKLYLELSQIATAKTSKELQLERMAATPDQLTISSLILRDENGRLGVISSGLTSDFRDNTNAFNVRYEDGREFSVTVIMSEIASGA